MLPGAAAGSSRPGFANIVAGYDSAAGEALGALIHRADEPAAPARARAALTASSAGRPSAYRRSAGRSESVATSRLRRKRGMAAVRDLGQRALPQAPHGRVKETRAHGAVGFDDHAHPGRVAVDGRKRRLPQVGAVVLDQPPQAGCSRDDLALRQLARARRDDRLDDALEFSRLVRLQEQRGRRAAAVRAAAAIGTELEQLRRLNEAEVTSAVRKEIWSSPSSSDLAIRSGRKRKLRR